MILSFNYSHLQHLGETSARVEEMMVFYINGRDRDGYTNRHDEHKAVMVLLRTKVGVVVGVFYGHMLYNAR